MSNHTAAGEGGLRGHSSHLLPVSLLAPNSSQLHPTGGPISLRLPLPQHTGSQDPIPQPFLASPHICPADSQLSQGKEAPGHLPHPTATHSLALIWDFTWILALLSGEVGHLASQVCQGILYNVSRVGRAGDSDVMLKRSII